MDDARFDPGAFWEFHLASGAMHTREGLRVAALPFDVLTALVGHAVARGDLALVRRVGAALGAEARASLPADPAGLTPEAVLGHAGTVTALFGLGRLGLVRYGDALLATLPGATDLGDDAVAALLAGLLEVLADAPVACVAVGGGRFLVLSPEAAGAVGAWVSQGAGLGAVLDRLVRAEAS
jgi:hypothetical protein